MFFLRLILILFISKNLYAGDEKIVKENILDKFTNSISSSIENFIGGEGDTQVKITTGEDYKPEFSIVTVKPISIHHGVDATFLQLQLNDHKVRGSGRLSTNIGIGYRKLSESKDALTGGNFFIDYDEKGNARASLGIELRTAAFEALGNYYQAISGGKSVGDYTERSLDGSEVSVVGQVPYLPWANLIVNRYEWKAIKNSKSSKGDKISLEFLLTPHLIVDLGYDDNNIEGTNNFANIMFVFPARQGPTITTDTVSDKAFIDGDMSLELLSIVRRQNKQAIESEGTGVVITRLN